MGQPTLKLHKPTAQAFPPTPEDDGLSSFATEVDPARKAQVPPAPKALKALGRSRNIPYVAAAFGAVLILSAVTVAFVATRPARGGAPAPAATAPHGSAFIDSRPQGAAIFIDGIAQGATPAKLALA